MGFAGKSKSFEFWNSYNFNFSIRDDPNSFPIDQQIPIHKGTTLSPTKNPSPNSIRNTTPNTNTYIDRKHRKRETYRNFLIETSSGGGRVSLSLDPKLPLFMVTLGFCSLCSNSPSELFTLPFMVLLLLLVHSRKEESLGFKYLTSLIK